MFGSCLGDLACTIRVWARLKIQPNLLGFCYSAGLVLVRSDLEQGICNWQDRNHPWVSTSRGNRESHTDVHRKEYTVYMLTVFEVTNQGWYSTGSTPASLLVLSGIQQILMKPMWHNWYYVASVPYTGSTCLLLPFWMV